MSPATVLGYLPFLDVLDLGGSFSRLSRKYGDVFSLKVGTETAVVLSSYDAIKSVLTDARFDSRPNTLMFKVRKAKGTQVQTIPVINFNLSHRKIEPLRGIWTIEPLTTKFYFVRAKSVPS